MGVFISRVFLEPLFPQSAVAGEIFKKIGRLINGGRKGVLLTLVSDGITPVDDK